MLISEFHSTIFYSHYVFHYVCKRSPGLPFTAKIRQLTEPENGVLLMNCSGNDLLPFLTVTVGLPSEKNTE
jgi:hypothetical protein